MRAFTSRCRASCAAPTIRGSARNRRAATVPRLDARFTPLHRAGEGPPLVCLHGFTDTWRSWELVLPRLAREHDVLALTLAGHAGGPAINGDLTRELLADEVERAMDELGIERAHIVGNSLGGWVTMQLAARDRAITAVALAPAGGWPKDDPGVRTTAVFFHTARELVLAAAPHADSIMETPDGRRRATQFITVNFEHIPANLLAHQLVGAAACDAAPAMIELGLREGWELDAGAISCPVRIVWGAQDMVLPWPDAAVRYREEWLPNADWVVLDDVGHCPQLDVPMETAELILGLTTRQS